MESFMVDSRCQKIRKNKYEENVGFLILDYWVCMSGFERCQGAKYLAILSLPLQRGLKFKRELCWVRICVRKSS
jgi:hypothetical protein